MTKQRLSQMICKRRARARRWLRRLPRRTTVSQFPAIGPLAARYGGGHLWRWDGWALRSGLYGGMVISLMPLVGIKLLLVVAWVLIFRANLPVALATQFVTNPLTVAPIYATTYLTGAAFLPDSWSTAVHTTAALGIGALIWGILAALMVDIALAVSQHRQWQDRQQLARMGGYESAN